MKENILFDCPTLLIDVIGHKLLSHLIRHGIQQSVVWYKHVTIRDHPHVQGSQQELPLILSTNEDRAHAHDDHCNAYTQSNIVHTMF